MQYRKWFGRVSMVAVLGLVATGCSGGDGEQPTASGDSAATPTESVSPVDPERVSPEDLTEVPEVRDAQGAVTDATFGECAATAGAQRLRGSVRNSTDAAADYVVVVSWVNSSSDVLARGVWVGRDVPAGGKTNFIVRARVPQGASDCTFQVQRGNVP